VHTNKIKLKYCRGTALSCNCLNFLNLRLKKVIATQFITCVKYENTSRFPLRPASQPRHVAQHTPRPVLLIVTTLLAQALASRPTHHCSKVKAYIYAVLENFRNYDPYRHKTQHVLHMVVTRLCSKFRHRMTRRFGGDRPQRK